MRVLHHLTSLPGLTAAFVLVTLLFAGPAQPLDQKLHGFWSKEFTPEWTRFLDQVPNAVAGQAVCLPILLVVAITLAWQHRSWRPLVIAAAAEVGFFGVVGGLKLILARTSPKAGNGEFLDGGAADHGWYGVSYPSGHAAEAILIYGAAAYLLATYADPDTRVLRRLSWVVMVIMLNALVVAFYLGHHWPSDLIGGVLVGALVLRLITDVDRALVRRTGRKGTIREAVR